jgi:hypothetical protein
MEKSSNRAVSIFAEAIALPPGAARDQLVADRCGEDPGLRRDVASLLHAHDDAGSFLKLPGLKATSQLESVGAASQGTAVMNAAVQQGHFICAAQAIDVLNIIQPPLDICFCSW